MIADAQKKWLDATIRNSTLITKSVDIAQVDTLRNVYMKIKNLTEED